MNYKSTNLEDLREELKKNVVTFEYTKKDGTVRTAKGTMMEDYLPERIPDKIVFEKIVIDGLMETKNISSLDEYAKENGLDYVENDILDGKEIYVFSPKKKKKDENLMSYYDIEKDSFRSFVKNNFLGIIE